MAVHRLFPTLLYSDRLSPSVTKLNREILQDVARLQREDESGLEWSRENYYGGYTSYGSMSELHRISSTFLDFELRMNRHVKRYVRALGLDLDGRKLEMTSCWVNVMGPGCAHSLHLHPQSVLSGTYYVQTPPGGGDFKVEDPRLSKFMGAPARPDLFVRFAPKAGSLVLFESWLRHEVEPSRTAAKTPRISVSFNYG